MRWGEASEDRIRLNERRSGHDQPLAAVQASLDFAHGPLVVLVPAEEGGDHAARIEQEARHPWLVRQAALVRERSSRRFHSFGGEWFRRGLADGDQEAALSD